MKICFFGLDNLPVLAPEYGGHGVGGAQLQLTLLAKALVRHGHEVSMVVGDYGQEDGAAWEGVRTYKAYPVNAGIPVLRFIHPRWTGAWSALKRADADVYCTSCAGMQVGLLSMFCRMNGRRLVFRIANDWDCDPDNLLIRFRRDKWLYEYGLRSTHAVVAQSEQQRQAMLLNYGKDSRIVRSLVEAPKRNIPHQERDIDVLWVSNLALIKRPELAIELARRLPDVRFHMAGGAQSGFSGLFEETRQQASTLPNLVFHGSVPYREVGSLYERSRLFINTSDCEGFPNSYLQAWVRGVPVVAFFDPDGVIKREGLGHAVSSLDEMAAAVKEYLEDKGMREAAGERCRAYVDREHGEEKIIAPYMEIFEDICAAGGKRWKAA